MTEDDQEFAPRPLPKTKCAGCQSRLTWAEQRVQYGRLVRRGLTREQIKALSPRCQKCMTVALRTIPNTRGADDA